MKHSNEFVLVDTIEMFKMRLPCLECFGRKQLRGSRDVLLSRHVVSTYYDIMTGHTKIRTTEMAGKIVNIVLYIDLKLLLSSF